MLPDILGREWTRMRDFAGGLGSVTVHRNDMNQPRIVIQEPDRTVVTGPHPEVRSGWVSLAFYPKEHVARYLSQANTWEVLELKGGCRDLEGVLRAFFNGMTQEHLPHDLAIMPIKTLGPIKGDEE